jgi:hypothetical protein
MLITSNYNAVGNSLQSSSYDTKHQAFSSVLSSPAVAWSRLQLRAFPLVWVTGLSPASATSFQQQQLTRTEPQQSSK